MANLRELIDASTPSKLGAKDDIFQHLADASDKQNDYNTTKLKLATKLAPVRELLKGVDMMHPQPDPNDPFQNPFMQVGQGGPGGTGQGLENQDDLARTGQMQRPNTGSTIDNYMQKQQGMQPGKQGNDANKKLNQPQQNLAQGKPQQRSASGNKPPKTAGGTDGKPVKKGKSVKIEVSDGDKMAGGGPGSGRHKGENAETYQDHKTAANYHQKMVGHPTSGTDIVSHRAAMLAHDKAMSVLLQKGYTSKEAVRQSSKARSASRKANADSFEDSMAADYHNNIGKDMPSVAHGLSASSKTRVDITASTKQSIKRNRIALRNTYGISLVEHLNGPRVR